MTFQHSDDRGSAEHLQRAAARLFELLEAGAFSEAHAQRARFAAGQLLSLGRALFADMHERWPVITPEDVAHRLLVPLRELRIVARWHGTTTEPALRELSALLEDLEQLLRAARGAFSDAAPPRGTRWLSAGIVVFVLFALVAPVHAMGRAGSIDPCGCTGSLRASLAGCRDEACRDGAVAVYFRCTDTCLVFNWGLLPGARDGALAKVVQAFIEWFDRPRHQVLQSYRGDVGNHLGEGGPSLSAADASGAGGCP